MVVKITSNLDQMKKNLEELSEIKEISFGELFNESFLASCSSFNNVQELFDKSGFKVESMDDLAAIPDDEWDEYIAKHTTYSNWNDMRNGAVANYTSQRLTQGFKKL